ncbi:tripartite motif-containing protein 3-like [Anneissia japonica]|uniref:tripartite motif-containing protein 3-like n=1 Tax=Anneissia japonica TaxID=1529436 RepID=UPI0014256790|nr:tripartite motif-containing protein 3-like [Anneissia japonica]
MMAKAHGFVEEFCPEILQCRRCLLPYDDERVPKYLPCLHTYCKQCLEEVSAWSYWLNCPDCDVRLHLPDGRVNGIPNNFFVENIQDYWSIYGKATTRENGLVCAECKKGGTAELWCTMCRQVICTGCVDAHKMSRLCNHGIYWYKDLRFKKHTLFCKNCQTKDNKELAVAWCCQCMTFICKACIVAHELATMMKHDIQPLTSFKPEDGMPMLRPHLFCELHETMELSHYCFEKKCQIPLCVLCASSEHADNPHSTSELELSANGFRHRLKAFLKRARAKESKLNILKENIEKERKSIAKRVRECKQKIQEFIEQCHELLDAREKELLDEVDENCRQWNENLDEEVREFEHDFIQVSTGCEFMDNALIHASHIDVVFAYNGLEDRIAELADWPVSNGPVTIAEIELQDVNRKEFSEIVKSLGNIYTFNEHEYPSYTEVKVHHCLIHSKWGVTIQTGNKYGMCETGGAQVDATIHDPSARQIPCKIVNNRNGTYNVIYTPDHLGQLKLFVHVHGKPISEYPFRVEVEPFLLVPMESFLEQESVVEIQVPVCLCGYHSIKQSDITRCVVRSVSSGEPLSSEIVSVPEQTSKFLVKFTPKVSGRHTIKVILNCKIGGQVTKMVEFMVSQ